MGARPLRLGRLLLAVSSMGVAAWVAYVTLVPLVPYQPICGAGRQSAYLEGPLRAEFVDQLVVALAEEGFRFRRIGDLVLVPYLDLWPKTGIRPRARKAPFRDLVNFQVNIDWRLADNIARGALWLGNHPRSPGRSITPPQPLLAIMRSLEPELGPLPPPAVNAVGAERAWLNRLMFDCALLRAALIRVEDLPPGDVAPRLRHVPWDPPPGPASKNRPAAALPSATDSRLGFPAEGGPAQREGTPMIPEGRP